MTYDVMIIGAGASGLFAAASFENRKNGLILNSAGSPGLKLLMSGSGQCNVTNGGDIKDFLTHYGDNGKKIRKPLYKFSNQALIAFLEKNNIPTVEREDGKVFPKSLNSRDLLDLLLSKSRDNGFVIKSNQWVKSVSFDEGLYTLMTEDEKSYTGKNLIVATGGASYPSTGSKGSLSPVFSALGIETIPLSPSLVPIFVENYGFETLSGISFPNASVSIKGHTTLGGLLLTHHNFSGPAILDVSRFASPGLSMTINYYPRINPANFILDLKNLSAGNQKQISTVISDCIHQHHETAPKRFLDLICQISKLDPATRAATVSGKQLSLLAKKLTADTYKISGTAGYSHAMCTAGGVSLDEIDLNTFECKKYPHLFIIGEALDVDGDTGGYNIQFAFTSGHISAKSISHEKD